MSTTPTPTPTLNEVVKEYKEINETLKTLEEQHREDLALHLYSAYLLKVNNQYQFPKPTWTQWPMPIRLVPMPRSYEYLGFDRDPRDEGMLVTRGSTGTDGRLGDTVRMVLPTKSLRLEIRAVFERLIRQKLGPKSRDVVLDGYLVDRMIDHIDLFLQHLAILRKSEYFKRSWPDILGSLVAENIPNVNFKRVFDRCHKLFVDEPLRYKDPKYVHDVPKPAKCPDLEALDRKIQLVKALVLLQTNQMPCYINAKGLRQREPRHGRRQRVQKETKKRKKAFYASESLLPNNQLLEVYGQVRDILNHNVEKGTWKNKREK